MTKSLISLFRKTSLTKTEAAATSDTRGRLEVALYGKPATASNAVPWQPPKFSEGVEIKAAKLLYPTMTDEAKIVLSFDATASRSLAWGTSTDLTVALLEAMPGQARVALAVHGGSRMHTFTSFEADPRRLFPYAASIQCEVGGTRMLDILERSLQETGVSTIIYIGDSFEEDGQRAMRLAGTLARRNIRLIILQDDPRGIGFLPLWQRMTTITGGCLLPFDASALQAMKDLVAAVSVLAVGGVELVKEKASQHALPGAQLLLQHIKS